VDLPLTLDAPARAGYTFGGWYADSDFSGTALTSISADSTGNKTFYAKWTPSEYTITYTLNGGNNTNNPTTYTVEVLPLTLDAPTRTNYIFDGWFTSSDFTGDPVAEIPAGSTWHKTVYAKWLPTGSARITFTIDEFGSPPAPEKAGNAFVGLTALRKSGGQPITITVKEDVTDVTWYVGLAKIKTGNIITLDAAMLTVGKHILRVTAKYDGVLYSKELPFTVTE
jgi:uncharacterized repeat protein (TIGR02543 family)